MSYSVNVLTVSLSVLMISTLVSNALASQMTAFLIPERDRAEPIFTNIKFITIRLDPESSLAKKFDGLNERITFTLNETNSGMKNLLTTINNAILTEKNSPVKIEKGKIMYTATLRGNPDKLTISYKIEFIPTMSGYVLKLPTNDTSQRAVDLDWRSVKINDPLTITVPQYGELDLNYPISALQIKDKQFADALLNSEAKGIMTEPLFDFEDIGVPMDRWHFLFDPTGSQASAAGAGYVEEGGASVVSVFSLGESSFREGTHAAQESNAKASLLDTNVEIHSSTPPPSGQVQISGFAQVQKINNAEVAFVSPGAPSGALTSTGTFPYTVLLVLAGMMGAVAVLVVLMARKKSS